MANHQISASQIRPGATIIIEGNIIFARVRSLMGPEDIDKANDARPNARFKLDRNKPMTRLALYNAQVVPADPNHLTAEEMFVHERMYESPTNPELGRQWNIDNKGNVLPCLFRMVNNQVVQIANEEIPSSQGNLPTEPARDQRVTVVLNVFSSNNGNNGVGLAGIIFPEEPQWFTWGLNNSIDTNALAARGIVFSGPITTQMGTVMNLEDTSASAPQAQQASPAPQQAPTPTPVAPQAQPPQQFQAPAAQSTVVDQASGLAMPAPVTQAVAQPAPPTNPLANQVMSAINQQTQGQGSAFGATPVAPAPTPAENPTAASGTPAGQNLNQNGSPWTI